MKALEVTNKIKAVLDEMWAELENYKRKRGEDDKYIKSEERLSKLIEITDKIRIFEEGMTEVVEEMEQKVMLSGDVPEELLDVQRETIAKMYKEMKHYLNDYWGFALLNGKEDETDKI